MKLWCQVLLTICFVGMLSGGVRAQEPQKDYLTSMEADKIRDAETTNDRIKLFVEFADDRLKKFQYELEHPAQTNQRRI